MALQIRENPLEAGGKCEGLGVLAEQCRGHSGAQSERIAEKLGS